METTQSPSHALSRRLLFGAVAGTAAASAVGAVAAPAPAGARPINRSDASTRVVLLGTFGGPTLVPNGKRIGIASAVVVGDRYYLIDAGHNTMRHIADAELGTPYDPRGGSLSQLRAIFLTHHHSDHVCDLPTIAMTGAFMGLKAIDRPVQLIGPGRRGQLAEVRGGRPTPPLVAPELPWPGTVDMWNKFVEAFATDFNDRARDSGQPVPDQMIQASDIALDPALTADPNGNPCPAMDPIHIYEDDRVKVTGVLVNHAPVFPSFAFRFDTEAGSVTFSGDTGPETNGNLTRLAMGTDVLVHEAILGDLVRQQFPNPTPDEAALVAHILGAHTDVPLVGPFADSVGAKTLVLNHLYPANVSDAQWKKYRKTFSGKFIVSNDLDSVAISR